MIKILGEALATVEMLTAFKAEWNTLTIQDAHEDGDSLSRAFTRVIRRGKRLQATLRNDYSSDPQLTDFYQGSVQIEKFWSRVDDTEPSLKARALQGRI